MPSIVKLVSAMFVANTIFLVLAGVLRKAFDCWLADWVPYRLTIRAEEMQLPEEARS